MNMNPPFALNTDTVTNPSPFMWAGGKYRMRDVLIPMLGSPLMSPFLGGGGLEIVHASRGADVVGFDADPALVRTWHAILSDPAEFVGEVRRLLPLTRPARRAMYRRLPHVTPAEFYLLNWSAYGGKMLDSSGSSKNLVFMDSRLGRLAEFRTTLRVGLGSFDDTIPAYPDRFLYVDPPYVDQEFYRHSAIDHGVLRDMLRERDGWVLSYADHPLVRKMYRGCSIQESSRQHFDNTPRRRVELIIRP